MTKLLLFTVLVTIVLLTAPALAGDISNFFTPYGFRAPLLERGNFALNLSHYYETRDSTRDHFDPVNDFDYRIERTRKIRYLSLSGVYGLIRGLIILSRLDFHPDQIIATHRYSEDLSSWDFTYENHSDFTISPTFCISFRPRTNIEFYGALYFRKEKLRGIYDFSTAESRFTNRILRLDFGITVLGRDFFHVLAPFSSSEVRKFLVPFGFRAPVINRGQSALGFGYHYVRTKSEQRWSDVPDFYYKTVDKQYHFSLSGIYALADWLILKGRLELYPGQNRKDYPGYMYAYDGVESTPPMISSDLSLSPHLDLSFKPKGEFEIYGSFDFHREEFNLNPHLLSSYMDERRESYYFDLGFSFLGSFLRRTKPDLSSDLYDFFTPYGFRTPVLRQAQYVVNLNYHHFRTEAEGPDHPTFDYYLSTTGELYYFSLSGVYAPFNWVAIVASLDFYPGQAIMTYNYSVEDDLTWFIQNDRSDFAVFPGVTVSLRPKANFEVFGAFYSKDEELHSNVYYTEYPGWKTSEFVKCETLRFDFGLTILGVPW